MVPTASPLVTAGMAALALLVLLALLLAVHRVSPAPRRRSARVVTVIALMWLGGSAGLAASGVLAGAGLPPPFLLILVPTLVLPVALVRSSVGRRLASDLPLAVLVGFHVFRLPLELLMHQAAVEGTMPPQMSFGIGLNYDVITALTAIPVAALAARGRAPRALLLAWNLLGSLLLAVIVAIAVASIPVFHAFGTDSAHLNTWIAHVPFVWLPAILVAAALTGHLLLWRRLLS